jgi:hypothetical protein
VIVNVDKLFNASTNGKLLTVGSPDSKAKFKSELECAGIAIELIKCHIGILLILKKKSMIV